MYTQRQLLWSCRYAVVCYDAVLRPWANRLKSSKLRILSTELGTSSWWGMCSSLLRQEVMCCARVDMIFSPSSQLPHPHFTAKLRCWRTEKMRCFLPHHVRIHFFTAQSRCGQKSSRQVVEVVPEKGVPPIIHFLLKKYLVRWSSGSINIIVCIHNSLHSFNRVYTVAKESGYQCLFSITVILHQLFHWNNLCFLYWVVTSSSCGRRW